MFTGTFPSELEIHLTAVFDCDLPWNCTKSAGFKTGFTLSLLTPNPVELFSILRVKTNRGNKNMGCSLELFLAKREHFAA